MLCPLNVQISFGPLIIRRTTIITKHDLVKPHCLTLSPTGLAVVTGMDYGAAGVWDSPMATDYYVRRFGFLWGGGSSGMGGVKAFQVLFRLHCTALQPSKGGF